ncbi:unnamed protein product, partial [Timema podura]|nr:unnamed protein product [Timema podura]
EVPLFRDVQNPVVLSTAVEIASTPFMPGRSLGQDKSTMTSFYRTGFSWARVNKPIKHPTTFKKDPKVSFDEEDEEAEEEVSVNHQSKINSGTLVHGDVARKELKSQVDEEVYLDEPEFEVDSILSKQPSREPTKKPGFFAKVFPCLNKEKTTSNNVPISCNVCPRDLGGGSVQSWALFPRRVGNSGQCGDIAGLMGQGS